MAEASFQIGNLDRDFGMPGSVLVYWRLAHDQMGHERECTAVGRFGKLWRQKSQYVTDLCWARSVIMISRGGGEGKRGLGWF